MKYLREAAERMLRELVLISSAPGDPADPIVLYVSEKLRALGMEPRYHGDKSRPCIVAQHGSGGAMLSGHLDTVPIGDGWTRKQGEVADGHLFGRGSADMKGGCVALLLAAEKLVRSNVPFSLCFTTDEETTMNGAGAAVSDPAVRAAPAVLIAEPSNFEIVTREKGLLQFSVSTKGRPAHASMPDLGENAIAKMVGLLTQLEDLQEIPENPLEEMTLSVDTIKGGTRINVVPGECEAEIDVRYPPPMDTKTVLDLVTARIGSEGYELKMIHELPPVEVDPDSTAIRTLKELLGPPAKVTSVPYATEMVMFRQGNPTIMVCGPADPQMAHVIDERIDLSQVPRAAELYVEFCRRMCDQTARS